MVLVHVDVGTQNLGCSVHNAARGRVPAIIVAGLSPVSTSGERVGARTEFIHYIQDTRRQHDIVDPYMKWSYELRAPEMVNAVLTRGMQIAATSPQGPVYITGAREIWDQPVPASPEAERGCTLAGTAGLMPDALTELHQAMLQSRRPLVITTYLGRDPESVARLAKLSEQLGFGVCEVSPQYVNFPGDHPHHLGYRRNTLVNEADLILMLDVDVPWIISKTQPADGAKVFHIDADPLKADFGLWEFPADRTYNADSALVLDQWLTLAADAAVPGREARCEWIADAQRRVALPPLRGAPADAIDVQVLSDAVRELVNERTVIVFEEPTATERLLSTLRMSRPGSYFANGGSGLGWGINAAIGAKLADPQAEVITLTGDGSYLFGVPSSAFWVAQTYGAPQLTIVFNNGGWNAPKQSTLLVHPEGTAKRRDRYWITVGAGARFADIATAASGAVGFRVSNRAELRDTLRDALQVVRGGSSAVVDVVMMPISEQVLGRAG
jgi:acetolactate synthase-1/2/3 large subunit